MPWQLQKDFRFESAHKLPNHDGKCARLHGHSWLGTVFLEGNALEPDGPKAGMVLDYGDVKAALEPIVERLDHNYLNEILDNPTSEEIARWVFHQLRDALDGEGSGRVSGQRIRVIAVRIEETCTARCTFHL